MGSYLNFMLIVLFSPFVCFVCDAAAVRPVLERYTVATDSMPPPPWSLSRSLSYSKLVACLVEIPTQVRAKRALFRHHFR